MIKIKRVYQEPSPDDGFRILVDRLWPRGVAKAKAKISLWLKEVAPSSELRKEFGHEPDKWDEFQAKYGRELDGKAGLLKQIKGIEAEEKTVTLLFAAKDEQRNNAVALRNRLKRRAA
jgi:uncharacterized protein YeaO (DUF488 family)